MKLTIKNHKVGGTNQDCDWSATLYVDGKKAALIRDPGCGAPLDVDWAPSGGTPHDRGPVHPLVLAYIKTLPAVEVPGTDGGMIGQNLHMVVDDLITVMLAERTIKGWCKKQIVALTPGTKQGSFSRWNMPPTSLNITRIRAGLDAKYGAGKYEIVNDRYVA